MRSLPRTLALAGVALLVSCGSDNAAGTDGGPNPPGADLSAVTPPDLTMPAAPPDLALPLACNGSVASTNPAGNQPPNPPAVTVASGFKLETVATVNGARQLAALPNGDLLVATSGASIYLVPNAEAATLAGAPVKFATVNDTPSQGITFAASTCTIYVATQHGVYSIPYTDAQQTGTATQIAHVRTGQIAPNSDGDVHTSSSVGFAGGKVYAGVGSSCNACTEVDPTRATVQVMDPDGNNMATRATRFRNAIALTTNPATNNLWAGGAGQDNLMAGHPYEFFDAVTSHPGVADYGWPDCEENHTAYTAGVDCSQTVAPLVVLPAYSTIIGATFYGAPATAPYAFPSQYRGGLFLSAHGSWHKNGADYYSPPRVAFVAMSGDAPVTAVDWSDPSKQWSEFIGGFQLNDGVTRIGRPTGSAVGSQGSLFLADDQNGRVYRIRPSN